VVNEEFLKNTPGLDHTIYLDVDGTRKAYSYSVSFSETPVSANAGATVSNYCVRRSYPISFIEFLPVGWHEISVVIDCDTQQGYAAAKNVTVECIYY
jgi:hypothetical protein